MNEYDVRVTRWVLEQMKEIVHYISNDLMAPDAAEYERGCVMCDFCNGEVICHRYLITDNFQII